MEEIQQTEPSPETGLSSPAIEKRRQSSKSIQSESRIIISFDIGVKNLAVCVLDVLDDTAKVLIWKVIALAEKSEKIPSLNELSGRLYMELDGLVEEIAKEIDSVIVENQPSRLNGTMKSIQMMIYSYFQLRRHWEGTVRNVAMVSAGEKLKGHENIYTPTVTDTNDTKPKKTAQQKKSEAYKYNKVTGIAIMEVYIKDSDKLKDLFNNYKKKDDLADAALQAVSWLRKHGNVVTKFV